MSSNAYSSINGEYGRHSVDALSSVSKLTFQRTPGDEFANGFEIGERLVSLRPQEMVVSFTNSAAQACCLLVLTAVTSWLLHSAGLPGMSSEARAQNQREGIDKPWGFTSTNAE